MARSIWSGTVSFGLVAIPVAMVPAVRSSRIAFHLLHDKDHARLRRRMVCPREDEVVPPEHIVRGFEAEADTYVVVTDAEIQSLEPKRSRTIEITDFVDLAEIDPIYYDRPYYLLSAGADKPYKLLVETLRAQNRAGLAKFVLHDREHLAALREVGGVLCLLTLHFHADIVAPEGLAPAGVRADRRQVEAIGRAVKAMSASFDPARYENEDEKRLRALVETRQRTGTVQAPAVPEDEEAEPGEVEPVDFMQALERSMERARRSERPS